MEQLVTSGAISTGDKDTSQPYIPLRLRRADEGYAAPAFVERVFATWNLLQLKVLLAFMTFSSHFLDAGGGKSRRVLRMASH
jgi:hypothetical protein